MNPGSPPPVPELKWLAWEVTRKCNLRCVHCRSDLGHPGDREFTTEEGKAFLAGLAAWCHPVVVLSGGEPLLRPDLFALARHGSSLGLKMAMATNGVLVTEACCREILDSGIKMVSLSLDGATAATHDEFRGQPGAFDGTLRAMERFRRHGIPFLINSSFTRRNKAEIPAVLDLARQSGAKAWYLFIIVPTGEAEAVKARDELISPDEAEEILRWHFFREREEKELLMRPICAPQYFRIAQEEAKKLGETYQRRHLSFGTGLNRGCLAGQAILFVDALGEVHPCSYLSPSAGNARTGSLQEIWGTSPLLASLRDVDGYGGKCGACSYRNACGGCRARAFCDTGDVLGPAPDCPYLPNLPKGAT